MNESNQRRIDKAEIERLGKALDECHASYGKTCGEITGLKQSLKNLRDKLAAQAELMRVQIAMHEGIVNALYVELEKQQPIILSSRAFIEQVRELDRQTRASDGPSPTSRVNPR